MNYIGNMFITPKLWSVNVCHRYMSDRVPNVFRGGYWMSVCASMDVYWCFWWSEWCLMDVQKNTLSDVPKRWSFRVYVSDKKAWGFFVFLMSALEVHRTTGCPVWYTLWTTKWCRNVSRGPAKHFVVRYDHVVVHSMSDGPIDVHKLSVWVYSTRGHTLDKDFMSNVHTGHHYVIHHWSNTNNNFQHH